VLAAPPVNKWRILLDSIMFYFTHAFADVNYQIQIREKTV